MKTTMTISRLCLVCLVLCISGGCTGRETPEAAVHSSGEETHSESIQWAGTWDAAVFRARSEEKPVLVTFYADWCMWCRKLENTTLADNTVAGYMAKNTVPIRLDADGDGKELSDEYDVDGLPTVLVLGQDGTEIGRIPGYLPPEEFLEKLTAIVG